VAAIEKSTERKDRRAKILLFNYVTLEKTNRASIMDKTPTHALFYSTLY